MILVIVYVGAVAVLFLFVVMMLDINFADLRSGFQRYLPVGLTVGVVLLIELGFVLSGWQFAAGSAGLRAEPRLDTVHNTAQLGQLIYTHYVFLFQASGLVLLVAMMGAIVLTLRDKTDARRQVISLQVGRRPAQALTMMNVRRGAGIAELGILRPLVVEPEETGDLPSEDHHERGHAEHNPHEPAEAPGGHP
jgi:NADH-quinone oxidoreductase subunit J